MLKKIRPSSYVIIIVFLVILSYALMKKCNRERHPLFILGISKGISKGVKGNLTLDYTFSADGQEVKGFVPSSFCDKCSKCCIAGDTVIVRYEDGNPQNNDLVTELPKDAILQ